MSKFSSLYKINVCSCETSSCGHCRCQPSFFSLPKGVLLAAFLLFFGGVAGSASAQDEQGRYEFTAFTTRADDSTASSISVRRGDTFTVGFGIRFLGATGPTTDGQPNRLRLFGVDARVFEDSVDVGTAIPDTVISHIAISGDGMSAMPTAEYAPDGINLLAPAGTTVTLTEDSTSNTVVYMYLSGLESEGERVPCNENECVLEEVIQVTYRVSADAPMDGEFTIGNISSMPENLRVFDSYIGVPI